MKKQTICLVGRPNTGKSTLFNRIVGKKISIIEDVAGVTRDRIYSSASFNDIPFYLIDTGGIDLSDGVFNQEIKMQVEIAIEESDTIVFVVDVKDGLTSNDLMIRDLLKKSNKKVVVAINKMDNKTNEQNMYEFYSLGFDEYYPISAEHGSGIKDMLSNICKGYESQLEEIDENIKISVIGRPNVGKSSLVNALLNEKRVIVSDVCVLVLDAVTGIVEHDKHIAGYALEAGKPVVLVVNKWDMIENKQSAVDEWNKKLDYEFQFMTYAKRAYLSAMTKKRLHTLMPLVLESYENSQKEIKTSIINDVIRDAFIETPPPSFKGKKLKIYFAHQSGVKPPRFDIEVNSKGLVHFSYYRYLENKIRANIDFSGTPIVIQFKNKGEKEL